MFTKIYTRFLVLIFLCLKSKSVARLTCQGSTYDAAVNSCPDYGAQKLSAGGNLSIEIVRAINLPNLDFTGPSSRVSDPYVKFHFGKGLSVKSRVVRNNLNPNWNEVLSLGTEIWL